MAGSVPALLLQVLETAKAGGLDLGALLGGTAGPASSNGKQALPVRPPN